MGIGIIGTGSYLPESVLSSRDLAIRLGTDEEWILHKTGIKERRIADAEEATSDLAAHAGRRALASAGITASDLDLIILASGTVDQPLPATACFVQASLKAHNATAFDVMAVCAGFLFGVTIARDMLEEDPNLRYALVVGSEVYSRFLGSQNKGISALLGDGAGAVILGRVDRGGILMSSIGSDGSFAEIGQIAGGGSRWPTSTATIQRGLHHVTMEGRTIRDLTIRMLPTIVDSTLNLAGVTKTDINLVVPHQANGVIIREWMDVLDIDTALMHETLIKYGNTGAASVPITLDDAAQSGRLSAGDKILFVSFGAGVSWGVSILEWT